MLAKFAHLPGHLLSQVADLPRHLRSQVAHLAGHALPEFGKLAPKAANVSGERRQILEHRALSRQQRGGQRDPHPDDRPHLRRHHVSSPVASKRNSSSSYVPGVNDTSTTQ